MKSLIVITALAMGMTAKADGFKCETESGLVLQVYNQTDADLGTRSAAVMVVSDENINYGNKTIAKFSATSGTLASQSLRYIAKVDLRFVDSRRSGELIAGTKLGYIDRLVLDLDFTYARPKPHGTILAGELTVLKRNGTVTQEGAVCQRYLKN